MQWSFLPEEHQNQIIMDNSKQPQEFFNAQKTYGSIICDGEAVEPALHTTARGKRFFPSKDHDVWICYRRNYLSFNVFYSLSPLSRENCPMYLDQDNSEHPQIQSMAVSLTATDSTGGKEVKLTQYTTKRDIGKEFPSSEEVLAPKISQHVDWQSLTRSHQRPSAALPSWPLQPAEASSEIEFSRIQFSSTTANNDKRTAKQAYYILHINLWANIQAPDDAQPKWVTIATRTSPKMVVRGRTPSHYNKGGQQNAVATRSAEGSGQYRPGLGLNDSRAFELYENGLSNNNAIPGASLHHGAPCSFDLKLIASRSRSSASSSSSHSYVGIAGGQHLVLPGMNVTQVLQPYSYYPGPLYESMPRPTRHSVPQELCLVKVEDRHPEALAAERSRWSGELLQGTNSSRGYYPDVQGLSY